MLMDTGRGINVGEADRIMPIFEYKCSYQDYFGYDRISTCPTRKEIYNKYKL